MLKCEGLVFAQVPLYVSGNTDSWGGEHQEGEMVDDVPLVTVVWIDRYASGRRVASKASSRVSCVVLVLRVVVSCASS